MCWQIVRVTGLLGLVTNWESQQMADEADIANEDLERKLTAALAKRIQYSGESALHCEECGDKIPAGRRKILPGVTTCADCQSVREREARRYGEPE